VQSAEWLAFAQDLNLLAFVATEGRLDSYAVECGDTRFPYGAPCLSTGFTQALVGVRAHPSIRLPCFCRALLACDDKTEFRNAGVGELGRQAGA
jgi:hypothetical protein